MNASTKLYQVYSHNLAEKMHTNDQIIDVMVDNLFRAAVMDRDEFHRKTKQNIRKTFDAFVHPFTIPEEDKLQRVGMRTIMTTPLDSNVSWKPIPLGKYFVLLCMPFLYDFPRDTIQQPFTIEHVLPVLHLEVPKRVVQYMPSATPIIDPSKAKPVKGRGQRGQPRQFKTIKRSQPEVASIYAEADEGDNMDSEQPVSKRSRLSKGGVVAGDDDRRHTQNVILDAEDEYEPVVRRSTPSNFYAVVEPLFKEFWDMEFDDLDVTSAFFAVITHMNCRDYKLETFAEQSYSLTVIKVSISILAKIHTATVC